MAFLFKLLGRCDHTKNFFMRQAMSGYRKGSRPVDGRQMMSYHLLCSLAWVLTSICFSVYEVALFQAAFVLAFFGTLVNLLAPPHVRLMVCYVLMFIV